MPFDPQHIETTDCPVCGAAQAEPRYSFEPFGVVQCTACDVYYESPRLTEQAMLDLYAQDDYFEQGDAGYDSYTGQEKALRQTFAKFLQNLHAQGHTGGALLEIGCGYGYLLAEARPYFDHIAGTDFSPGALEKAQTLADAVYLGGIADLPPDARYDCIVATNVLEHTYDPIGFLSTLTAVLNPGGVIAMAVPNIGSPIRHLMGHRWPSFKVPEHTLYFEQATLNHVFTAAGLNTVAPLPFPHAFPLALIASKFGLSLPPALGERSIWVPTTMVAAVGKKP